MSISHPTRYTRYTVLRPQDCSPADQAVKPSHSDKMLNPNSPLSMPDIEASRSNGLPSPDSFIAATLDTEYQHLKENIRRIRKAASDAKKVDAAWEVYKKLRDESLQQCKGLLAKSRKGLFAPRFYWGSAPEGGLMDVEGNIRNGSLDYTGIGPLDARSSYSGSGTETALPFQMNDQWLSAIREYKATQELMLKNLQNSLLDKYLEYEPNASDRQVEAFLADKARRKNVIAQMRDTSVHRMKSEKHMFWDQYQIRSSDFEKLKIDLQAIERLINPAGGNDEVPNMAVRECVIAQNGDTILEFANAASENHPILRFRVSSHLLAEHSPLFAQFLSPQPSNNPPLDMISQLPPPPTKHICKDGMEVKVYRMPQIELNKNESLKHLLHAAHMHKDRVPRQVTFQTFVSIAEVCLKYQCTQPLEMHVEYQWLPQWIGKLNDDEYDGFLVISYAFGLRRIFTRMSKTAILNAVDEDEIRSMEAWPQAVKEKIIATRAAKLAQIYDCCNGAIAEYLKTPSEVASHRRASVIGSLQLTTSPRCPRGSHVCDATNLGWLMLVYNELGVLPSIMKNIGLDDVAKPPRRSLKELIACLGLMPSAPQVHSGVCNHAPLFRNAINDVYNSVTGLTFRDVSGKDGWALSKNSAPTDDHDDHMVRDLVELEAPLESLKETKKAAAMSNEEISFRILSYLDEMPDLTSAAMIDQSFYRAYKQNEATLLKNVINAERRRTMSQAHPDVAPIRRALKAEALSPNGLNISILRPGGEPKSLAADRAKFPAPAVRPLSINDLYDASPPLSPMNYEELTQEEHDEAYRIIWGEDTSTPDPAPPKSNGQLKQPVERNEKCLVGDVAHTGDKARLMEEEGKHLREEQERELGQGKYKK
jgi:hypothetical protein